jgi:short-subunit dehydrogenase
MHKKGSGTIVNITSMGGKIYTLLGGWYQATKHALEGWSDCMRLELAPFGIKVVLVEPGLIETGFGDKVAKGLVKRSDDGAYARLTQVVAIKLAYVFEAVCEDPQTSRQHAAHSLMPGRQIISTIPIPLRETREVLDQSEGSAIKFRPIVTCREIRRTVPRD